MSDVTTAAAPTAASSPRLGGELRYRFSITSSYPSLVLKPGTVAELHYGVRPVYIPNSPGWFRGVMNRRSAMVPVFDITQWLGLGRDSSTARRGLLLMDLPPKTAGLWILGEPVLSTLVATSEADISVFPDALHPYISGAFASDEGDCFEFDHVAWFRMAGGRANV
jgi:chemotaxis signal transduction protein